jgi:hypothetical protein
LILRLIGRHRDGREFVIFLWNLWVPSSPGLDLVNDEPPFGSLWFTVSEVDNALLDSSKAPGSGNHCFLNIVLLDLHCLFICFSTSLATCIFPDRWQLSFVTPIFKSGISQWHIELAWHCDILGYCQVVRIAGVQGPERTGHITRWDFSHGASLV